MSLDLDRRSVLALLALVGGGLTPALTGCAAERKRATPSGDASLVAADVPRAEGDEAALPETVAAMSAFGGRLYAALADGSERNLALSPYSVMVALAMTLNGAGGSTAEQMREVLGGLETTRLNGGLNALTRAAEGEAGPVTRADGSDAEIELAAANQLFGDRSMTWADDFLTALARDYGAGLRVVDFQRETERARTEINDWTAEQTRDRIPEILPDGVLDAMTRLVLVNALYLKAPWESPFEKTSTAPAPFHRADGTVVQADTMAGHGRGGLVRGDGWRAARLPYAGGGLAMTVVLPDDADTAAPAGLSALEAEIGRSGTAALLAEPGDGVVVLRIPKWRFRATSGLGQVLTGLGMTDAFDPDRADFDAMTGSDNELFVGAVLHETFIAVDEEGTEAAAATAVVMEAGSAPVQIEELVLNRPFLFVIHDTAHGIPLFVGRVSDPTAA